MENRYIKRSHITETKFRLLLRYFCEDFDATETSHLTHISRITINKIYALLRERLVLLAQDEAKLTGEAEIDESYFGARRIRGKRGRGALGKTPVVGHF